MNIRKNILAMLLCIGLLTSIAAAQNATAPSITVTDGTPTGMFEVGQTVTFHIAIDNVDLAAADTDATYRILENGVETQAATKITDSKMTVSVKGKKPGFLSCVVTMTKPAKIEKMHFAGVEVEKLQAQAEYPDDFMAFWNKQKESLAAVPMNPVVTEVEIPQAHLKGNVRGYNVRLDSPGALPVQASIALPADASAEKKYPIRVSFHGATYFPRDGSKIRASEAVVYKTIIMDVNPFGIENGHPLEYYQATIWKDLRNNEGPYPYRNWDDRDKVYFKDMYIRVLRALEYAKSRPEWDGKNLIVEGSSMGGAQAIVGAALDPQVSACVANVPALCDLVAVAPGWPFLIDRVSKIDPALIRKTAPYYDSANFARQIKVQTLFGVGLDDVTCQPPTVWAAYNNLQGPKKIVVSIDGIHNWNPEMRGYYPKWITETLH